MKEAFDCPRLLIQNRTDVKDDISVRKKRLKSYDLHWHDCFEIELILSGSVIHELNGITYTLGAGDIYLLNPTDFHRVQSNNAEVYNIMFSERLMDDELLQKILSVDGNIAFRLNDNEFKNTVSLISQMLDEFKSEGALFEAYIKNLLECLFIIILRNCTFKPASLSDEKTLGIRKALLYIHSHFRENPSMSRIAEISGFNKNYFSSLFHKATGQTYKSYLTLLKLEYAKKLVLSGRLSITEICFASGFNSLPNFLRSFKSAYGTAPGNMRRLHSSKSEAAQD